MTGELIASGRDGAIYDHGPGLVLRKTRDGRSLASEARAMRYAADHGYPVPKVHELRADDTELVMERIDGPLMLDVMLKPPWRLPHYMSMLADLHDRLHEIPGQDWMRRMPDGGDRFLHLDLHPLNVMLTSDGPVVIDWTNAARGDAITDVATSFVLLTCPRIPGPAWLNKVLAPGRTPLVAATFAKRYRGRVFDARVAEMCDLKSLDLNMTPDEVAAMQRLAAKSRRRAGRGAGTGE
jgi:aminoglycoside phosphotransferase (APT) family kinase protein